MSKKTRGKNKKEIYEIIKKAKTISLKEIRTSTTMNYNTVRSSVIKLTNAGFIKRVRRGVYRAK